MTSKEQDITLPIPYIGQRVERQQCPRGSAPCAGTALHPPDKLNRLRLVAANGMRYYMLRKEPQARLAHHMSPDMIAHGENEDLQRTKPVQYLIRMRLY